MSFSRSDDDTVTSSASVFDNEASVCSAMSWAWVNFGQCVKTCPFVRQKIRSFLKTIRISLETIRQNLLMDEQFLVGRHVEYGYTEQVTICHVCVRRQL